MSVPVIKPEKIERITNADGSVSTRITLSPLKLANAIGQKRAKQIIDSTSQK